MWCSDNVGKHVTCKFDTESTLASSLTNISLSLTKLLLSPKLVTITFVNFSVSGLTLTRQLPVLLLPLSFTPNLITVILSTINSLSLNYPVSSRSRTLLLVLSWKLPSHVISLPSYTLSTDSESLNASNTSSFLSYIQSSHNYPTSIPS